MTLEKLVPYVNYAVYFFITFLVLLAYVTRNFSYWKNRGIPYIKPFPFIGNGLGLLIFRTTIGDHLIDLYRRTTGPFVGFFIGDRPYLLLRGLDIIKLVLVKDFNHFMDRTIEHNYKSDPLGSHILFTVANPDWKNTRPKVSPIFSSGKIKHMFYFIRDAGICLQEYIDHYTSRYDDLDAKKTCGKYSIDVIASCAFGIKSNTFSFESNELENFAKTVFNFNWKRGMQMTCSFIMPTIFRWTDMTFLDPGAAKFFEKIFSEAIAKREASQAKRNDLIDILIKLKGECKEGPEGHEELQLYLTQATQFFIAGFETVTSTITFGLYELANHEEAQEKLREEVERVSKEHGGFTYEAIQQMHYLSWVTKEVLRMYPVLPFLDRTCTESYKIPDTDIVLEKGTRIHIPVMAIQYDSQYFDNPYSFMPERFKPENQTWPKEAYLTFGEGPRNCIGERFGYLTVQVAFAMIVSKFKVERSKRSPKKIVYNPKGFLLAHNTDLYLKFTPIRT